MQRQMVAFCCGRPKIENVVRSLRVAAMGACNHKIVQIILTALTGCKDVVAMRDSWVEWLGPKALAAIKA
jgi:hypothetical protein